MVLQRIKSKIVGSGVHTWYGKYERPISSFSLVAGFVFDAVMLKRVDMFWENMWVIGHLVIVGVCMVLIHKIKGIAGDEGNPDKAHFWLVNVIQFFFGGLISVFLVFYFRSGDLAISWPFFLILALVFWANESLKRHFVRLNFQISLFFLSLFLCAIYLVPVFTHRIGAGIFILSGIISLALMITFLRILSWASGREFQKNKHHIVFWVLTIFTVMHIFYFANIIPPIPLALKDSGIYHSFQKDSAFNYIVSYEDIGWTKFLSISRGIHIASGDTIYAYSAVFSPTSLNTTIVHRWQYYDPLEKKWTDMSKILLPVVGGRDNGFRTYSAISGLSLGKWRVNVETLRGQVIGRLRFTVIFGSVGTLKTKVLN
ncbi:MAG: hypothetical protein A2W58_02875 [Candidatus Zambryskibacteria bacterium RIFCSPHIGHO2_02_38_10.5]|uniref:DUF2914 domain-containing protein n=1 Tax=Candidatus Zambryskibacteria bacterium RIFCSPHIGHO2_02_38_10.5 TaxID=1802742 RepID=A0A1G2T6S5_9BACT|nr:MAG: hypothetical protein A2W58_02875 [Candidatus Zambryskibacteria bacterium RIFCSPHIGHO2_02_38_10.5]